MVGWGSCLRAFCERVGSEVRQLFFTFACAGMCEHGFSHLVKCWLDKMMLVALLSGVQLKGRITHGFVR
jgi:hypothetical protein